MDLLIYLVFGLFLVGPLLLQIRRVRKRERAARAAAERGKLFSEGPRAQHPHIDISHCIGCGACVDVCPEGNVLAVIGGMWWWGFDFGQIKVPTLFVHHRDDGCVVCPYTRARDISSKYGFPLITVTGATNPTGDPCQAYSHHGFRGREKETMAAILKWVKSRDVTETIN